MADLNSDSSASSGENSGNSNSTDQSKASRKSRTSWAQNWPSKPKTDKDGRVLGTGNAYYDHLVDRQSATRAVAIVVHAASKRGYVTLCTEFASLLRDNKRMEIEINRLKFIINQMKKKGTCGDCVNQSKQCYSSSTSESGSGGSQGLKTKTTTIHVKPSTIPATLSSCNQQSSSASMSVEAFVPSERKSQTDSPLTEHQLTTEEELKQAKEQIFKLERQLSVVKAENQALRAQVKHSLQIPTPQVNLSDKTENKNKSTKEKNRVSPEILPATTSLNAKETISAKADNLKHDDQNCCLKSCVKHRIKNGSRILTVPRPHLKISSDEIPSLDEKATGAHNLMPLQLQKNNQSYDKKPHEKKPKVLPELGDYVTVQGEIKGYVNYVGPLKGEASNFVGIQLPAPVGNNDGSIDGEKFFTCPPNYGTFIPLQDIKTVDSSKPCRLSWCALLW